MADRQPPGTPDWAASVGKVRPATAAELPPGYAYGLRYAVPLVEMPLYLPWLVAQLRERGGEIQARQFDLVSAGTFSVDKLVTDASPDDYDALLLPGGTVNPDQLRINPDAVAFVRAFAETGKPIAAICHGPWTLITAGVVKGRRLTSWPSLRDDLRNAGAEPVDEQVVVDGQFTTSRSPADLPAFCPAIVEQFAGSRVPS